MINVYYKNISIAKILVYEIEIIDILDRFDYDKIRFFYKNNVIVIKRL